ncbi:uncharacterized protein LOC115264693 [Aedes albopictus]|uniref:Uncharacterized protein n=1 Tax=Aedes albopictus TaxID=7160 RepID=A0ABM2A0X0_AEDAL|nr:uncharacterized protein LOC115264693 [Aedes albopictus]KXJ70742.1 hypothetical protein RP20_CCG022645 [Aedes albopictus]
MVHRLVLIFLAIACSSATASNKSIFDQPHNKPISSRFVSIRKASNHAHLCWAIKVAPTAFATSWDCLEGYRKTQITMVYGDIEPTKNDRQILEKKIVKLARKCRHSIENIALLVQNKQSLLFETVLNYVTSYGMLGYDSKCKECRILKIQRRFRCPVKNIAIVYNNCIEHVQFS